MNAGLTIEDMHAGNMPEVLIAIANGNVGMAQSRMLACDVAKVVSVGGVRVGFALILNGELDVAIADNFARNGLGSAVAKAAIDTAWSLGATKIFARAEIGKGGERLARKIGFAELPDKDEDEEDQVFFVLPRP